jgi:EmrB/QacA subfamily drug resistance transporter
MGLKSMGGRVPLKALTYVHLHVYSCMYTHVACQKEDIMKARSADIATAASANTPEGTKSRRRWLALAVLAAAQFMVFLDETVVNVALPSIKVDLGFSEASLSWVVSAYIVTFGGLVLLGGRLADLFGRRRTFLLGTAVFGLASLLDGFAPSQELLVGARALQGIGAAVATPAALALVTDLFPAGPERMRALSLWGALSGLGFALGILLGGAITDFASWRWVFFINAPVALATLFVVPRLVAERRAAGERALDLWGALAVTAGMTTLVYAVVKAPDYGWSSLETHAFVGAAIALLLAFTVVERRSAAPLVPARFLHRRAALVPNVLQGMLGISAISTLFLLTLYVQQVLGYSPLQAGVAYLPLAVGVAMATALANRVIARTGPRPLAIAGLAFAAVGIALLGHAPVAGDYATDILPAMVVVGLGAGLSFVSITTAALATVEDEVAGLASGLLSTTVQIGGAVGVAALVTAASQRTSDLIASGAGPLAAQVGGLQLAFFIAGGVSLAAALVAALALKRGDGTASEANVSAEASS